jgi:hypothetical protein
MQFYHRSPLAGSRASNVIPAVICCVTSRDLSAPSEFRNPQLSSPVVMAKKRALEEPSGERPGSGEGKGQRKGFSVGPANLPDGTYRRKGTNDLLTANHSKTRARRQRHVKQSAELESLIKRRANRTGW